MLDNPQGNNYYGGTVSAPIFRSIAERIITITDIMINSQTTLASNLQFASKDTSTNVGLIPIDKVPDVRGLSVRRAIDLLVERKLHPVINGSGIVCEQFPKPGELIKSGMNVTLVCKTKLAESLGLNH